MLTLLVFVQYIDMGWIWRMHLQGQLHARREWTAGSKGPKPVVDDTDHPQLHGEFTARHDYSFKGRRVFTRVQRYPRRGEKTDEEDEERCGHPSADAPGSWRRGGCGKALTEQAGQRHFQLRWPPPALGGVDRQSPFHDHDEGARQIVPALTQRHELSNAQFLPQFRNRLGLDGILAADQPVKQHAQRVHIGRRRRRLAPEQFGRADHGGA